VDPVVPLKESSLSVNVGGHGINGLPNSLCVARWDLEEYGESPRGRHLNVYQPRIEDKVHWPVPGQEQHEDWPLPDLLKWIVTTMANEFARANWPRVTSRGLP
jgi:hypothetical protein